MMTGRAMIANMFVHTYGCVVRCTSVKGRSRRPIDLDGRRGSSTQSG